MFFKIFLKIILGLVSSLLILTGVAQNTPKIEKGILDLEEWNFEMTSIIPLKGQWEIYPNQLLSPKDFKNDRKLLPLYQQVPNAWNNLMVDGQSFGGKGFATYRLHFRSKSVQKNLALRLHTISTACKIFINDSLLIEIGKVGKTNEASQPSFQPQVIELPPLVQENSIIIQVSNFHYDEGGIWRPIEFGLETALRDKRELSIRVESFLWGTFFIVGFYFLGLYLRRRKQDNISALFFSLFCFSSAIRTIGMGEFVRSLDWLTGFYFEYLGVFFAVFFLNLFMYYSFIETFSKTILRIFLSLLSILILLSIVTTPIFLTGLLPVIQGVSLSCLLYACYVLVKAYLRKKETSFILLIGIVVLILAACADIFLNFTLLPWGVFVLILCMALSVTYQFLAILSSNEELSLELQDINQNLEELVAKRTKNLEKTNQNLIARENEVNIKNEELHYLNEVKDKLFSIISHDLKGPIGNLKMLFRLLEEGEISISEFEGISGTLSRDINQMYTLIENLLYWSKSQMVHGIEARPIPLDLKELVEENIALATAQAKRKNINLINQVNEVTPIFADKEMIKLIIRNLLNNSIKFTPNSKCVSISATSQDAFVNLIVQDEGIGMSPEVVQNIFQAKTTSLSSESLKLGKGTGLGLMLCQEFIEKNNGKITVTSEIGKGSKFTVQIPRNENK